MEKRFLRISSPGLSNIAWRERKKQALFSWFKRSIGYETFLEQNKLQYKILRGEVYEIDFGTNIGSELNERHYAVVIHNSDIDAQNIVVVPLTTKKHYSYMNAIELGVLEGVKTNEISYAKISQIRTVDKARIYLRPLMNIETKKPTGKQIGPVSRLSKEQFDQVIKGLNNLINCGISK
ncbi:MAG TPA: type II toxin-antitoxin system PemK/MazF family toxin [Bacilli bacterium]|nr:type II toxin-antitoxin system PemK/MazF family toxin [Bacilli bacterium]